MKTVLVTGAAGQVGSTLCEYLLGMGHHVIGMVRRTSSPRLDHLTSCMAQPLFEVAEGDVADAHSVRRILKEYSPALIFNLAAMSHVHTSFDQPSYTWDVVAGGPLNFLEAIREMDENDRPRFFQASSSEMFGQNYSVVPIGGSLFHVDHHALDDHPTYMGGFQDELTPFCPNSPYAIAKLAAHHAVRLYRESYGLWACSGILFNMEGPRRGENFVTRKITRYIARWAKAIQEGRKVEALHLGNLKAQRDWNWVGDSIRAIWMMIGQPTPADYVISTGDVHSVEDFLLKAFQVVCPTMKNEALPIEIDQRLMRPAEVPFLKGSSKSIREKLGWEPTIAFTDLVKMMVMSDLRLEGVDLNKLPVR